MAGDAMPELTPEQLLTKLDELRAAIVEERSWVDRQKLFMFALGAVLSFGGSYVGMRERVATMTGAIEHVTRDLGKLETRHDRLEERFNVHVATGQHAAAATDGATGELPMTRAELRAMAAHR